MNYTSVAASCHCGAVRIALDAAPERVTDCNCSICRRYGVLWAYYSPRQVHFTQPLNTDVYLWGERQTAFHRCRTCGCVTHWSAVDPSRDKMGVNARLLEPQVLVRAKVGRLDGALTWEYKED